MSRLERVAKDYRRGVITIRELVWDAWTTAREDGRGAVEPVEALRRHLSADAYQALQDASQKELDRLGEGSGFIPYDRCSDFDSMETSPEFVPRTFVERLAAATQNE